MSTLLKKGGDISVPTAKNYQIQDIIEKNCRAINQNIGCYEWKDHQEHSGFKTLSLYSWEKEYHFHIEKKYLTDLPKLEDRIKDLICHTLPGKN